MTTPTKPRDFRGTFRADDEARAVYAESAGIRRVMPAAVAVPADVDDLVALVRWAAESSRSLTVRGSGSSMPGAAVSEGVIVDLSRWRMMGAVDVPQRTIRVGPGVTRGEVDRVARAHGLRFPVDPSSGAFCTVGGMASTNAAGAHTLKFGSMRAWVNALDCVFSDASRAEVRRGAVPRNGIAPVQRFLANVKPTDLAAAAAWHEGVLKDSSGYRFAAYAQSGELVDLLVGSEGTLALFTELELRLEPVAAATSSVFGAFASLEAAIAAAARAKDAGAVACELLDRTFLDVAASGGAVRTAPAGTESALLAEVEGTSVDAAAAAAREVERMFRDEGATTTSLALDSHTETELWELRHAASPILARLDPNLKSMQVVEDGAVPRAHVGQYVRGLRQIFQAHDTPGVIFGHAGDCHVHANVLVDVRHPDWRERVRGILDDTVTLTAQLGGTLSGEHGDGRLRAPFQSRLWPAEAVECFRAIRAAFDPAGIFNPGVKLASPGDDPLGAIKYDPSLPPLPPRARAVLDRVERERGYANFRLDLLADT